MMKNRKRPESMAAVALAFVIASSAAAGIPLTLPDFGIRAGAAAVQSWDVGSGVKAVLDSSGTMTVKGSGPMTAAPWFTNHDDAVQSAIKSVVIGEGVTEVIGFWGCDNLETAVMSSTVETIGDYAFASCDSLKSVTLNEGLTLIDAHAFGSCDMLETVNIPSTVKVIGDEAFRGCYSLKKADLPVGIEEVGELAFAYTDLTEVTLPNTLDAYINDKNSISRGLGRMAFIKGEQENITLSLYMDMDCCTCEGYDFAAFYKRVTWSPSVYMGAWLWEQLADVPPGEILHACPHDKMPAGGQCPACGHKDVSAARTWELGNGIKAELFSNGALLVSGSGAMPDYNYNQAFPIIENPWGNEKSKIVSVTIGSGITHVGNAAFTGCGSLKKVSLSHTVKEIGRDAFEQCRSLSSVSLNAGLEVIGRNAFAGCSGLEKIEFPSTLKKIGSAAFESCKNLVQADLPVGIEEIEDWAFMGANLSSVTLPNTIKAYIDENGNRHGLGEYVFLNNVNKELKLYMDMDCLTCDHYDCEAFYKRVISCKKNGGSINDQITDTPADEILQPCPHNKYASGQCLACGHIYTAYDSYRDRYKVILSKPLEEVTADDSEAINNALNSFDGLSAELREKLVSVRKDLEAKKAKADKSAVKVTETGVTVGNVTYSFDKVTSEIIDLMDDTLCAEFVNSFCTGKDPITLTEGQLYAIKRIIAADKGK